MMLDYEEGDGGNVGSRNDSISDDEELKKDWGRRGGGLDGTEFVLSAGKESEGVSFGCL